MANNDILQYLRKTPHNTNVNVVKGMIGNGNGSGAIEMVTLFDDDINLTYTTSQYGPAYGLANINIPVDTIDAGFILVTYEGDHYFGIMSDYHQLSVYAGLSSSELPFININLSSYSFEDKNYRVTLNSNDSSNPELEAYCQEPHHLKVEWFTV